MLKHQITSEYIPAGQLLPDWFFDSFATAGEPNIMVVHPNEFHRQQTIQRIVSEHGSCSTDLHVTYLQVIRLLHVDLRLPVLLDDDVQTTLAIHEACFEHAESGGFPLLHSGEFGKWNLTKTGRIMQLHSHVNTLEKPFRWREDPGVEVFDKLLRQVEHRLGGTLPTLVERHVFETLPTMTSSPFHFSGLDGILLLNHPPTLTELQQQILIQLSTHCPIHHLIHPGSFRLGYHGAYLVDEQPCTPDTYPNWMVQHHVSSEVSEHWRASRPEGRVTRHTRIPLHTCASIVEAGIDLVASLKSHTTQPLIIVDANAARHQEWSDALKALDIYSKQSSSRMSEQPILDGLVRACRLSTGLNAWSIGSIRAVSSSQTLPLKPTMFDDLQHPTHPTWKPRLHLSELERISTSFHVLGGPGALRRWLGSLSRFVQRPLGGAELHQMQIQEETQWWLMCMARVWAPLMHYEDGWSQSAELVGCGTLESLPLPPPSASEKEWLTRIIQSLDFDKLLSRKAKFDGGLSVLHRMMLTLDKVYGTTPNLMQSNLGFSELLEFLAQHMRAPMHEGWTADVHVLTPQEAFGCQTEFLILAGCEANAWNMQMPVLPWLDAEAQLQLGMFHQDTKIREGRHVLRHFLNAASHVIVFDSSPEEGNGPSAPLAEWLHQIKRSNEWNEMRHLPEVVGTGAGTSWQWSVFEQGHQSWLTYHTYASTFVGSKQILNRLGHRPRDRRQQTGLEILQLIQPHDSVRNPRNILLPFEASIHQQRASMQPNVSALNESSFMSWDKRSELLTLNGIRRTMEVGVVQHGGLGAGVWPTLGFKDNKKISMALDPRPLPPFSADGLSISDRFGQVDAEYTRNVWSASQLSGWLTCPRRSWHERVLNCQDKPTQPSEDLDVRTRGQIFHDVEAALLSGHGAIPYSGESANILPLHLGPLATLEQAWDHVFQYLSEDVPWLQRHNVISVQRIRELLNITPSVWAACLEQGQTPPLQGALFRMLQADFNLKNSAPIACEFALSSSQTSAPQFEIEDDDSTGFSIRGFIDRVDVVVLPPEHLEQCKAEGIIDEHAEFETPYPMKGDQRPAKRLVIIRDLKSVVGPSVKKKSNKHLQCLFQDLQLALYSRAWELLHPNDRVIGIGATEVGESTTHYIELDETILPFVTSLDLGQRTTHIPLHYPSMDEGEHRISSFRMWMTERILVAGRAVYAAQHGHFNPTPGRHCSHCPLADSCEASSLGGESFG